MRLSALSLKLIAIAAMVVDHVAFTFVPYGTPLWTVMDAVGKLTGPIMFYMAVEGFHHTMKCSPKVGQKLCGKAILNSVLDRT